MKNSIPKLFLGMTLGTRPDWEWYFAEPVATRSSKPESVAKEVARKREEREAQAHFYPVAGTVHTCVVLDIKGEVLHKTTPGFDAPAGESSYRTFEFLQGFLLNNGYDKKNMSTLREEENVLFGLRIRDRLRIMALDAIRYANNNNRDISVIIPELWYHRAFEPAIWCDPYEGVIPSERRNDVPYDGLCAFLDVELAPNIDLDTDPEKQADIARQIALKTGLVS